MNVMLGHEMHIMNVVNANEHNEYGNAMLGQ